MLARIFLALSSVAALGAVVACTSTTIVTPAQQSADAGPEELPVAEITENEAGASECTLDESSSTGRKTCDDCLQKSCCVVIQTCFADEPCSQMNSCINACRKKHGITSQGEACVRECGSKDAKAAEKNLDMLDCQNDRCRAACKG